jgi:hypothetical protein
MKKMKAIRKNMYVPTYENLLNMLTILVHEENSEKGYKSNLNCPERCCIG